VQLERAGPSKCLPWDQKRVSLDPPNWYIKCSFWSLARITSTIWGLWKIQGNAHLGGSRGPEELEKPGFLLLYESALRHACESRHSARFFWIPSCAGKTSKKHFHGSFAERTVWDFCKVCLKGSTAGAWTQRTVLPGKAAYRWGVDFAMA
jgi:hypothetical protein